MPIQTAPAKAAHDGTAVASETAITPAAGEALSVDRHARLKAIFDRTSDNFPQTLDALAKN